MKKYNELLNGGIFDVSSLVDIASKILNVGKEQVFVEYHHIMAVSSVDGFGFPYPGFLVLPPNTVGCLICCSYETFYRFQFSLKGKVLDSPPGPTSVMPVPVCCFFDSVTQLHDVDARTWFTYLEFSVIS